MFAVAGLAAGLLVGCSGASHRPVHVVAQAGSTTTAPTAARLLPRLVTMTVATLDPGYQQPDYLFADSRGVWFYSASRTDARIFHATATSTDLESWPLGADDAIRSPFMFPVLAFDGDGNVWVGVNTILVELNPATGTVTRYPIGPIAGLPPKDRYGPPEIQGFHAVIALAANGSLLTVGVSGSQLLQLFDLKTRTFRASVQLPANTEVSALRYFPGGEPLAVGVANYDTHLVNTVLLATSGGHIFGTVQVPDAFHLGDGGTDVLAGSNNPALIDSHGSATQLSIPSVVGGSLLANGGTNRLPNGDFVFVNPTEMVVASQSGRVIATQTFLTMPGPCGAPSRPPPAPGQTLPPVVNTCPVERPDAVAIDAAGHIWTIVQGEGGQTLIQATTLTDQSGSLTR